MKPNQLPTKATPISIWQPMLQGEELAYVRPPILPLGDHYADRTSFLKQKKTGTARICFFGESVAAGYLYAPQVSPAKILGHVLGITCGESQFEVIDLARTNETLDGLLATVESAAQLQPDVIIIFSGNNWAMLETPELSPYFPTVEARRFYAQVLREGGMNALVQEANWRVIQKAAAVFSQIEKIARAVGSKVILMSPEVNLVDWENRQACPWLPGNGTTKWYRHFEKAKKALQNGDWQLAIQTVWAMEDLDGSLCPTTYRLLYHAFLGQGDEALARKAAQAEVDSNRYVGLCFLGAPQINSGFRKLQQKAADQHQFALVDLAKFFEQHTCSCLPDRRMFLDYCHLTLEGMQVAMAATAVEVLKVLDRPEKYLEWPSLFKHTRAYPITPEADATAKFGAAIHSAHRLLALDDGDEILKHWCSSALAASPSIRETMLDFFATRIKPIPAILTATQHQNFNSLYPLSMQHGLKYNYIDAPLLKVLERLIDIPLEGIAPAFDTPKIDLIHPPYHLWAPVERLYPEAMQLPSFTSYAFFRAAWPESSFALLHAGGGALSMEMTLRLPTIPGWAGKRQGKVVVKINGKAIARISVDEKWTKVVLPIGPLHSSSYIIQLSLVWPSLPPCGSEAMAGTIKRLELGQIADLHPIFGEVFSLQFGLRQA